MGDVAFSASERDRHLRIDRFAAQYLAHGLPCERFTAALASRASCITRGRGGWLDLPRGGLSPPILCQLPGALADGPPADSRSAANVGASANHRSLATIAVVGSPVEGEVSRMRRRE